jgi:1-acyl-sn-glycerol-3-phosphate acyltransferase
LKDVLLWEPLLDVALTRMGACFLPARSGDGQSLADRLGRLAGELMGDDALLLFPEGANWTPGRRVRAIAHLRRSRRHRAALTATLMENVLPPRPSGVMACLDARPGVPVVVFAHTGLDLLTSPGDAWRAIPFRVPMTVRWWPAADHPAGQNERLEWLTTEWAVVDEWIDTQRPRAGVSLPIAENGA